MTETKPPIGLKPADQFIDEVYMTRLYDIALAMQRYKNAEKEIPDEWTDELCLRLIRLNEA